MTWEIVTGIIALLGVFGLVGGWLIKLSKILTMLDTTIQSLKETLENFRADNKQSHKEFYDRLENHEKRISILEQR